MRKLTFIALFLSFFVNLMPAHAAGEVIFIGVRECSEWFDNKSNSLLKAAQEGWLTGYLSGLASVSRKNFLSGSDNATLYKWVDIYCRITPLGSIDGAGNEIAKKLIKDKGL